MLLQYGIGMSVYVMMGLSFLPLILIFLIFAFSLPGFKIRYGLIAILLGLLSLIPIVIIQSIVRNIPVFTNTTLVSALITVMVFNGFIEESVKMLTLNLLPHKKTSFSTFFALSLMAGLALGCFETVIYLFSGYHEVELRTVTAVAMHSLCTSLSGVFVWTWRNPVVTTDGKKKPFFQPYVWAVILHGSYNFFAGFSGFYRWFSVATIILTALECRIWFQKILNVNNGEPVLGIESSDLTKL